MAPKQVSVGVQVELQAKASSMKKLYEDVSNLMANIDPSSALAKSMSKALGKLRDQVSDFESISGKSFISSSDLTSALNLYKRFYRDINRMNESIQGAGFNSFIHEDSVIQALQKIQDELDNVKSAAEQIKTINIGDAFKVSNKDQKNIKDLQQKFSLKVDDDTFIEDARAAAIDNLIAKTEEYNKALARQEELSKSQQKIAIQMSQYSNLRKTHLDTEDQRKNYSLGKMYDVIGAMKGNWVTDLYESSFTDLVNSFFQTAKSGQIEFADFGRDRVEALANLLGIDLSKVSQDAVTIQQEVLKALSNTSQSKFKSAISSSRAIVGNMAGYQQAKTAFNTLGISDKDYVALQNQFSSQKTELNNLATTIPVLESLKNDAESLQQQINDLYDAVFGNLQKDELDRRRELNKQAKDIKDASTQPTKQAMPNIVAEASQEVSGMGETVERNKASERAAREAEVFKANLKASIKHWMGTQQIISLVKQGIRQAYQDIQNLDKAMTNIAVVTDFNVSDLWGKINEYMAIAKQYGVTTQGVYEVSQLYFQQGLGEADTMALTTETLKMARIAGMEYKDAADGMTVALRGFKMEMEDAARVTDVYSKVAAVTASDSQELIEAMSKTASSAASVGSGFEETTAMLAVMIEATREAPTNIGSAMKSIISRYGEMTKGMSVDTEGEEIIFNKVDAALQSVGVSMKDATGQFREFDEVIYELASKWESLDSLSQRYVATVFAGNRQQSRFLALMSNYDRLIEVTEDAQNSEDAGLLQYSKTLDSLETKLNNVKTSFQQFYMDIFDGEFFKGAVDGINNILKGFNKLGKAATAINLFSLIIGTKAVANSFIDNFVGKFVSGFSQITQAGKNSAEQIKNSFLSSANQIRAGLNAIKENNNKNFIGPPRATKAEGITQILTAAPIQSIMHAAGSGLTLLGTGIAAKNQGLGGTISSAGSGLNVAASTSMALAGLKGASGILGTIGSMAGPIGLAAGALTAFIGIISTIPSEAERAQQEAEKAAEKAEKSNIKRAEAREKVRSLEDGVENLEELGKKRFDSDEDMQAWLDANNALFEKFPELTVKFDEAGNSIVNLTSAEAELTAAREAASNAARQAAADEYDKAKTELEAKKKIDLSDAINDKLLQDQMRSGGINAVRNYLLQSTGIEKNDKAWAWAATTKDFGYNDLIASFVENVQNETLKPKEGYSQSDIFKRMIGFTGVFGTGGWASEEEINDFIQGINTYRKEIDSLNRYVDAARASKIAAESASVLDKDKKYIDSDYKELESAYEVIQDQVIEQFSFDAEGNKLTGEIDSNKVAEATTALADDFVNLYTDLFNSNNIEEFNSLIQKALTGKITQTDFKENLKELGASEEIINAYLGYIEDSILLSPDDFKEALESRNKGNEKYSHLLKLNNELTEQNRRDIINNEIEFFEAQLEAGKITEGQIADYIKAYANFIEENKDNQNLIDIFTSGNLTTLEGIQETEKVLQEAGWSGELDWATLIPTSVINFTTSYENLMDKTIASLEGMSESFDTASDEMELKDAQEIAKKLGKDVSIFDDTFFEREGESFFATQEAIDLLIEKQKADIEKEAEDYLAAIGTAKTEISAVGDKDSLLKKYSDTAAAAVVWAKGNIKDFDQTKTVEDFDVDVLQNLINQYYSALENNIKSSSENYIDDLTTQLQASFDLQQEGRSARKAMISDALDGLGIAKELQEQAYSLLGKLSQDVTTNLDETEYALFDKVFGDGVAEKYLIADGAGGWQIDIAKSNEFIKNYKDKFGTFAQLLLYNSFTTLEEKTENLLSDAASIGEDISKGKIFDANDLRALFEPILGELETEVWNNLLVAFLNRDWLSFSQILIAQGIKADSETAKAIISASNEMLLGYSRGVDEQAQDILEAKYDYISGKLSSTDIKNLAEGTDEEKAYKTQLVEFAEKTGEWALLTLEQQYNVLDEVLASDTTLTDKERFEKRESERKRLLEESQGQTLVDYGERRDEAYDLIAETGGKGLTPEEVASLESIYGELDKVATLDGWEVALPQANAKVQDALLKYQENVSQNAADGAKDILSAMAEGTLTGVQIQDYFEELDINIDYATAENLANGTLEGLLESIKTSLADSNIDVSDKMDEIMAVVIDAILNSISSGISSLGSGLEGTLGVADYQSLAKKYSLTGVGTSKSSKGVRLGAADQKKLISQMFLEAQNAGLSGEFGDQLWEVWRDSTEDTIDGYTKIDEQITTILGNTEEWAKAQGLTVDEAEAYVKALQQARHAAMFDEDSVEFAFMEQDATDGLTKNFDKFVDNIDKVKDAFSAFKSGEAVGYQDFYNIMDYMNRFGADGKTNSFIQQIEKSGHTYESFVNSVVVNTDKWGKVDIGGVAAEMGISVEAAMSGMAKGMEESLKEVAKQQVKYLSSLEAMLEALLILESIGEISFGLNMSIDIDGDGINDLNFATYGDLFDWYEKLPSEQQKTMLASIKLGFENRYGKETGGNIFSGLFGDGDIDFLDKALGSVLDNEKLFNKFKQDINDPNGVFKKIMSKVGEDGSLGEGLGLAVMDAFNIEGVKWEDMFSWGEDNSITGWGPKLLEAIGDSGLTPEQLTEKIFSTLLNIDPNTITASFASKLSGQTISLEGMEPFKLEMGADGGIQLPEGVTISPDNMAAFQSQIESIIGKEITNLKIGKDGKITFDLASATEGVDDINTDFQTAAEAASTLQTAITQISTVASSFQAGSGFQSLADQLNAAADAAERLASALGIKIEAPKAPQLPFGTGKGQFNGMDYLSSQDILGLGMGPLSPEGLNAQLNQMFATQFAGDAALQIPAKIVGEGGADVTDALKSNLLSKPAISVPGKLDLSAGGKGVGKEADKVEIEAEVNTESADEQLNTLKTSMDTVNETPVQVDTTDNGTTQAVTELLNAAYEAAVLVEESDPNTAVTETGSTFVKEQLDAVAQAANSIPTSINISVSVSGVAKALGSIALLKLAGGLWTGNINDIGGPALADGNTGESARKLIAGANIANKTLVGELGPELMVYNNQYQLVGQNGAEFVKVPKDAIVFNHLQTKGIFNGQMGVRGKAMVNGNVTGPAAASGIAGALAAVRRAKSVWQGLLNSLSAADLMGGSGGGGGGGGDDAIKAHIEDLEKWYNLSQKIAAIERDINLTLAKRKNITNGHEYAKNLFKELTLLQDQLNTQQDLLRYQEIELKRKREAIKNDKIWSQFLTFEEDGTLQYIEGNETNGGEGTLKQLKDMVENMSGEEQLAYLKSIGWSYTNTDGEELEDEDLVAQFFTELDSVITEYNDAQESINDLQIKQEEILEQYNESLKEIRDNEIELGQNIYDIIVAAWEENIKNLKKQNDLIKEANEAYAEGIQEAIDAERKIYEQNETINDREQLQRQLALRRRIGGSASEIADLEKQLDNMLKDEYFANQEDALENIRDANERQAELLNQQVKIQEESLEYEKENGVIWSKVYEIMQGTDAEILDFMQGNDPSFFEKQALEQENMLTEWAKKIGIYTEERQRQNYAAEAAKTFSSAWETEQGKDLKTGFDKADSEQQEKWKREYNDTYASKRLEGMTHEEASKYAQDEFYEHIQNWLKALEDEASKPISSGGNSGENSDNSDKSSSSKTYNRQVTLVTGEKVTCSYAEAQALYKAGVSTSTGVRTEAEQSTQSQKAAAGAKVTQSQIDEELKKRKFATGGIIDFTGPAWVDGSKSKPERILSAEQNRILEEGLAMNAGRSDRLREMFSNFAENLSASVRASISNIANRTNSSAITIQPGAVQLNIEQLNDKYDVDELFNDVADRLYSIAARASGRGVNRR